MPERCEPGGEDFQPGEEAGERLLRHGQLNVVGVTGGELDDDAAGAEDAVLGYTRVDTLPIEHDLWRFYHLHP